MELLQLLLTGSIYDDFKDAKQQHCRELTAICIKYPNKDKTPHFSDSLFVFLSRTVWVTRPSQPYMKRHAPVREVKVDPLRSKACHPLPNDELSFPLYLNVKTDKYQSRIEKSEIEN